jgi:CRP/FNR family transcriptional regulator
VIKITAWKIKAWRSLQSKMVDAKDSRSILAALPTDLSTRLFAGARPHRVAAGEPLFHAGDPPDGCYRLETGLLKLSVDSQDGERLVIGFLGEGATVGELAMIDGLPRSATAHAVKDTLLSFITSDSFNECLTAHPEVYKYLVECLAARLREANDALAAANFLNSEARLARAMLELAHLLGEHQGDGRILIQHPIRVYDLAAMAGIARENVSRILGGWERRGIVTRSSRLFYINEPEGLRRCKGESDSLLKERAGMHPL